MDRGAWRSTVHKVAQSQTRLKRLSTHCDGDTEQWLGVSQMNILGKSLPRRLASRMCKGLGERRQLQRTTKKPIELKKSELGESG